MLNNDSVKLAFMVPGWGERLKSARLSEGLDQIDIAKACGVTNEAVSQWENDKVKSMTAVHLFLAAAKLRRNPLWIALNEQPEYAEITDQDKLRWDDMYKSLTKAELHAAFQLLEIAFRRDGHASR